MNIELPHNWRPRPYQLELWKALEGGCKRAVAIWHRRAGKDITSVNWMLVSAMERVGTYWHILPTYAQGRKIVWDGMTSEGRRFLDYIPAELIDRVRNDEMKVWLKNGSILQIIGAEDPSALVGTNPVGCTFSEYSIQNPAMWDFVRPILAENGGWALFIFTPRGRNHGYRLFQQAKANPSWFVQALTVEDTGAIPLSAVQEDRDSGMPEELIQQEYYVSWEAALVGSYFAAQLAEAEKTGRIGRVPWEPSVPVSTAWDLGMGDLTCIWFRQKVGAERRIIDFYYNSGAGLDVYAKALHERPYVYDKHFVPHDASVRELGTGKSRIEVLRGLGLRATVARKLALEDGINAVRQYLPGCWFDAEKCAYGLQGLREYMKERIEGEQGPNGEPIYQDRPKHNWASHPADAFRTLAICERASSFPTRPTGDRSRLISPRVAIV